MESNRAQPAASTLRASQEEGKGAAGCCAPATKAGERLPAPLNRLPWDLTKDEFGGQTTDFLAVMGALLVRAAKDQIRPHLTDPARLPGALSPSPGNDQCLPAPY